MEKYALNPYLPCYEYIPDGEPHVFGDRVYIYGSHDRFGGKKFCMNDYVCYSADVKDLANWRYEGVIYPRNVDPRMADGKHQLWAPDVCRGKDGRYYLFYCPDDSIKSIGVAVADSPAGEFHFYGIVSDRNGGALGERPGDTIAFDPGVFVDDDGQIYLYSGNGPRTKQAIGKEPKASMVVRLMDDMKTMAEEPKKLLPTLGESEGTGFEGHEFFEASSIRKIGGKYYLVYSSVTLHELCYAVSDKPDEGFVYGGVVVSNADIFPENEDQTPKNCYGNDHGGIECINGEYYIFYHRQTNRSMFSRQGCAERIKIEEDGSIKQVLMTSQGLNGGPLPGQGVFPANCCAELMGKHTPVISFWLSMGKKHPYLTQDLPDTDPVIDWDRMPVRAAQGLPKQYIANGKDGMRAVYRYFAFENTKRAAVKVRGTAVGVMKVFAGEGQDEVLIGEIPVHCEKNWKVFDARMHFPDGVNSLSFVFEGKGVLEFLAFGLSKKA